ncbi:MAG: SDR family NAD(P)-dependent oxidoreductase [Alphaproteobacteria bacterium]|jgi:NAD(P)-dependent dehydrogenase (short-subunit alcohol dehydrogenase family)|nr:SDR family NAD(P)-dependent oxidoreductase [Alphaproteobacteria bacterium]MBT5389170.1 SDR family NAD(P)-dependent oxidoreductase [Alphaproteobacteria bacterium]MBT5654898.1 SDR family NAD(P)-dependent oxidoreductase [Alphaproteobacteria bacterium]
MNKSHKRLLNKVALVTGASRGLGRAIALKYAQEGAHVILVARDLKALEALDDQIQAMGGTGTIALLDLTDGSKIDALAAPILERYGKLDILVANAAILGTIGPTPQLQPDVWEKVFATNTTANWRLIRALDTLLRRAPQGHIYFVTSAWVKQPKAFTAAYAASKAALESLANTYKEETKNTSLQVQIIDPGAMQTDMYTQVYPGKDASDVPLPEDVVEKFVPECLSA